MTKVEFCRRAENHLFRLRKKHKITRRSRGVNWETAHSYIEFREISAPKVREGIDYLVNLHEIGHIVSTTAQRYARYPSEDAHADMMKEAAAWAWAVLAADPALMAKMGPKPVAQAAECFLTYMLSAAGQEGSLLD